MVELVRRPWSELAGADVPMRPRQVAGPIVLGAGARVCCPDSPAGRAAADRLVEGIAASGGPRMPIVAEGWGPGEIRAQDGGLGTLAELEPPPAEGPVFVLGSLSTNPRMAALYHAWLCPVDASVPGAGGYFLRSYRDVHGDGVDIIVIGVSADEDLPRAVDRVVELAEGGQLPHLHETVLSSVFAAAHPELDPAHPMYATIEAEAHQAYITRKHRGATPYLTHLADMFSLTARPEFAQLYLSIFQDMMALVAEWVPDVWGRWGFDADFQAARVVSSWHAIADTPLFTDLDRERMTGHLVEFLGNSEEQWHGHRNSQYPARHNHYTFAALGLLYGALTLGRTHRLAQTAEWVAMADECFTPQLGAGKSTEDCEAYGWLTLAHTLRYALLRPVPGYFRGGRCATVFGRGITTMDNLGAQVPYGDASSHRGSFSEVDFWRAAAWTLADERYAPLIDKKEAARSDHSGAATGITSLVFRYDLPAPTGAAAEFTENFGVHVLPLDAAYTQTHEASDPAPDDGFDKISFRDSFDTDAPYLLLDGIDNGGHGHRDAGAIIRYTSKNRIWLEDAEYDKTAANFHSTLVVARDGIVGERPAYAHLGTVADDGRVGVGQSVYRGYSGADWTRTIVWIRAAGFVVVDEVTAVEAGEFDVRSLWRTVGHASVDGDVWTVRMGDAALRVHTVPPVPGDRRRRQIAEKYARTDWGQYPYADDHETVLQDSTTVQLAVGESARYVHLLTDSDDPSRLWSSDGRVRGVVGQFSFDLDPADPASTVQLGGPAEAASGGAVAASDGGPASSGGTSAAAPARGGAAASAAQPVWSAAVGGGPAAVVGDALAVAGSGGGVRIWRGSSEVGSVETAAVVTALAPMPDGGFIAGQSEGHVEVFGPDRARRWGQEFLPHMGHPAAVNAATTAQLTAGAPPAVVIGTESCHLHAYTDSGEPMWSYEVVHAALGVAAADLDGDGLDEVLGISGYWSWHCVDGTGEKRFTIRGVEGSGGNVVLACGDLALFGGWDGHLTAYRVDGERVWDLGAGDIITAAVAVGSDVLAASRSGWLYRVDGAGGAVHWRRQLDVDALTVVGSAPAVAVGTELLWLGEDGSTVNAVSFDAPITDLWAMAWDGRDGVCVRGASGVACWLSVG